MRDAVETVRYATVARRRAEPATTYNRAGNDLSWVLLSLICRRHLNRPHAWLSRYRATVVQRL